MQHGTEYAARNQADIVWMQDAFPEATRRGSAAVMFISQADPGFDATDAARGPVRDRKTLGETDGLMANLTASDVNWLKVIADSLSREVFTYQQQIVPANRVAVPAPQTETLYGFASGGSS